MTYHFAWRHALKQVSPSPGLQGALDLNIAFERCEHDYSGIPELSPDCRDNIDSTSLPRGVPRINASPPPWRVIQKSDIIGILYESDNAWRQIFLDGRELGKDFLPAYLGYSTGKWDGDTLVVDTRGFNGKTWLDQTGKPTSDALHVTERFRRTDFGHMEIQITIDDPKVYTKPWQVKEQVRLMPDSDIFESACENNRDLEHLRGKFSR